MTKSLSNGAWKLRATGALVLALALSTFPAAFSRAVKAQTPAKATAQTPAKATTSPASESKGLQKEGIKVHGHWTINVRNPDGKVVTHREFENGLEPTNSLPLILGRQRTVGEWEIQLSDTGTPDNSPCNLGTTILPCQIIEPTSGSTNAPFIFRTLTLSVPSSVVPDVGTVYVLVLSGTATATRAGQVKRVSTHLFTCGPTTPASACIGSSSNPGTVTSTVLTIPIGVSAGQIIQVTVTISFS